MDSPIVAPNTPEDGFDSRERAVFRALDGDRDGVVSSAELGASLVRGGRGGSVVGYDRLARSVGFRSERALFVPSGVAR